MNIVKTEIELPELKGYKYTGERRLPKEGEYFLGYENKPIKAAYDFYETREIILKKEREFINGANYPIIDTRGDCRIVTYSKKIDNFIGFNDDYVIEMNAIMVGKRIDIIWDEDE